MEGKGRLTSHDKVYLLNDRRRINVLRVVGANPKIERISLLRFFFGEIGESAFSSMICTLRNSGLLIREPDEGDARRMRYRATAKGRNAVKFGKEIEKSMEGDE